MKPNVNRYGKERKTKKREEKSEFKTLWRIPSKPPLPEKEDKVKDLWSQAAVDHKLLILNQTMENSPGNFFHASTEKLFPYSSV